MENQLTEGTYLGIVKVKTAAKVVEFTVAADGTVKAENEATHAFDGALSQEELNAKVQGLVGEGYAIQVIDSENDKAYLENLARTSNGETAPTPPLPAVVDLNA